MRSSRNEPPSGLRREERMRVETAACSLARNKKSLPKLSPIANRIGNGKRAYRQFTINSAKPTWLDETE